jgi:hypothetical protein
MWHRSEPRNSASDCGRTRSLVRIAADLALRFLFKVSRLR